MMHTRRNSSRKRYQTVLPSSIQITDFEPRRYGAAQADSGTQSNLQDFEPQTEQDRLNLLTSIDRAGRDRDPLTDGPATKRAVHLADSQLPYQRSLRDRDYARNIAAQLELSNEETSPTRGQTSSETDRSKTDSSKTTNSSQHESPVKVMGQPSGQIVKPRMLSGASGDSSALWNHRELLDRLHPRLGPQQTPYMIRHARKTPIVIEDSEPDDSRQPIDERKVLDRSPDAIQSSTMVGESATAPTHTKVSQRAAPARAEGVPYESNSTVLDQPRPPQSPPKLSQLKQGRTQLEELRRLIPPPLPVRHVGRPTTSRQASTSREEPLTREIPEYECVEGVTLDTQPVAAKEKSTGLPLPVIEAQDIRNIPSQDMNEITSESEDESAVPRFNFVKRSTGAETDHFETFARIKKKIQQSSAFQAILPSLDR